MIKLRRINDSIDFYEVYRVILDGRKIAELKNDERRDFNIEDGRHTLKIVSDNYVSNTICFDSYKERIIEFEIKPDHKDGKASLYLRKIFLGKLGILIEKKEDFYL